jgi:hypothetical protein
LAAGADAAATNSAGGTAMALATGLGHRDVIASLEAQPVGTQRAMSPAHRVIAAMAGLLALVAIPIMGTSTVRALARAPSVHLVR